MTQVELGVKSTRMGLSTASELSRTYFLEFNAPNEISTASELLVCDTLHPLIGKISMAAQGLVQVPVFRMARHKKNK